MTRALLLLGCAWFWSLVSAAAAQDFDTLRRGVVQVIPKSQGQTMIPATGFIVRSEANAVYVVTASHTVEGADEVGVEFFSTRRLHPARILGIEGGDPHGLAALIIEGDSLPDSIVLGLNPEVPVRAGEPVTMIGFPRNAGAPWAVTRGGIVGRKGRTIIFSGAVDQGSSGGPLIKDDQVVGVITQAQGPYAYATPSLLAQYALESWGVRFGVRLRSQPTVLHIDSVSRMIKEKGFNHPARFIGSPEGVDLSGFNFGSVIGHFQHGYDARSPGGDRVVIDHSTGLMWQQSGSMRAPPDQVDRYLEQLNRQRYAGFADWRLPTIEELLSLVEATGDNKGVFVGAEFDPAQVLCLSADALSIHHHVRGRARAAVQFEDGALYAHFGNIKAQVRAVRTMTPQELRRQIAPGVR